MTVRGVYRDDVGRGQVRVIVRDRGTRRVDVMEHPPERGRCVKLDVQAPQRHRAGPYLEAVVKIVGAVGLGWDQTRKSELDASLVALKHVGPHCQLRSLQVAP